MDMKFFRSRPWATSSAVASATMSFAIVSRASRIGRSLRRLIWISSPVDCSENSYSPLKPSQAPCSADEIKVGRRKQQAGLRTLPMPMLSGGLKRGLWILVVVPAAMLSKGCHRAANRECQVSFKGVHVVHVARGSCPRAACLTSNTEKGQDGTHCRVFALFPSDIINQSGLILRGSTGGCTAPVGTRSPLLSFDKAARRLEEVRKGQSAHGRFQWKKTCSCRGIARSEAAVSPIVHAPCSTSCK